MQSFADKDVCLCPPIICPPLPPSYSPPAQDECSKYYQEIGANMIGNQLIIRMEKDKSKSKKKREEWDPPCDCVEIQRPTSKRGPRIVNADYDDRIVFRVHSSSRFQEKEETAYKSQTIAYKIGSCKDEQDSHQCKTITVYPHGLGVPGSQEVYTDHITEGNQDIFLLKIKKKADCPEQKNRNVELEVRTPKLPTPQPAPTFAQPQPVQQPVTELIEEEGDVKEPVDIIEKPKKKQRKKKKNK